MLDYSNWVKTSHLPNWPRLRESTRSRWVTRIYARAQVDENYPRNSVTLNAAHWYSTKYQKSQRTYFSKTTT